MRSRWSVYFNFFVCFITSFSIVFFFNNLHVKNTCKLRTIQIELIHNKNIELQNSRKSPTSILKMCFTFVPYNCIPLGGDIFLPHQFQSLRSDWWMKNKQKYGKKIIKKNKKNFKNKIISNKIYNGIEKKKPIKFNSFS